MPKRSVRDMLKARAWKGQVSLADVDPGDRLGVKRKQIAAAREKYGPELLGLSRVPLRGEETSDPDCSAGIGHQRQGRNGPPLNGGDGSSRCARPHLHAPSATELRHHFLWRFKKEMPGHRRYFSNSRGGPGACSRVQPDETLRFHFLTRQRIVLRIRLVPRRMLGEHWFLAETGRGPPGQK
jgi:hypothetical protein